MKITHRTRFTKNEIRTSDGYGYATNRILHSLNSLGYEVLENDNSADASFWFDQPWRWHWNGDKYKIGYHPWESTKLLPDWIAHMNKCDEVWTTSPLIARWYK